MSSKLDTNTVPGYIDHLGIITDQRPNPGEISITENGFVYLPYDKETDDEIVTLLNNSSQFRSIKCSELTRALSAKSYFREGLSYAENDNTFKIKLNPKALGGGEVPTIIHPISQDVSKFSDGIERDIIFDEPELRGALINLLRERRSGDLVSAGEMDIIRAPERMESARQMQERQLDLLADVLRANLDWELIYRAIGV